MPDLMGLTLLGAVSGVFSCVSVIVTALELLHRLRVRRRHSHMRAPDVGVSRHRRRAIARSRTRERVPLPPAKSNRLLDRVRYELSG